MNHNLLFLLIISAILCSCGMPESDNNVEQHYDLLITNARIVDGTGTDAYKGDIVVHGGIIKHIGDIDHESFIADSILDANGRVVAPGFIDVHSHGDPLKTPHFKNFTAMGITTISLGQDGSSVETKNIEGWMNEVQQAGIGPNIIHLKGHGTLHRLTGASSGSELSTEKMTEMQELMNRSMVEGSFGMTTGLEYEPGSFADIEELAFVAEPVAKHDGIIMSHLRNEDDDKVEESIDELMELGRRLECKVHISHLKIVYGNDTVQADHILDMITEAKESGVRLTADIYPYAASYTGIGIVFPPWAKEPNEFEDVVKERRDQLADYLRQKIERRNGPEATLFGTVPWTGMTLAEVADSLNKPFEDVLIDDIGPNGASAAYFVMNEKVMEQFLQHHQVMISTDGSPNMQHPRSYGSFAKIIRKYVMEEELLSLEEAVHKMTGLSAETLGLSDTARVDIPRGLLKADYAADLVIFSPENVLDRSTFENPHVYADGFDAVLINGVMMYQNGEFFDVLPGEVIRRIPNE